LPRDRDHLSIAEFQALTDPESRLVFESNEYLKSNFFSVAFDCHRHCHRHRHRHPQENAYDAFYRLSDPRGQIQSYVFDVIRSTVPRMELDEAFASKKEIASATMEQLESVMKDYGYEIMNTLVTDLSPDARVKASMNEINASKRLKEASSHKAEADKVQQVKAAEADAEAKYLSGLGVARQRKAIVTGLQSSIAEFSNEVDGVTSKDVMDILLLTQYFDTLKDVGANNLLLEHEPGSVAMLQNQVNKTLARSKKGFLS
jgi:regulator of protease activity HflC (stomatin/prohibitin superfamily)